MVKVEVTASEPAPAVLTSVEVSDEDIVAAEPNPPPRHTVEGNKQDYARDPDRPTDEPDTIKPAGGELGPGEKIEGAVFPVHRPGHPSVDQRKSPPNRRHMDREKGFVQDEALARKPRRTGDRRRHAREASKIASAVKVETLALTR